AVLQRGRRGCGVRDNLPLDPLKVGDLAAAGPFRRLLARHIAVELFPGGAAAWDKLVLEESIWSGANDFVDCLKGSVFASRSGMMKEFCTAIASISNGKGRVNVIFTVLSSATPHSSTDFAAVWPNVLRAAQRARLAAQSCARTGSPSCHLSPSRNLIRKVRPSSEIV